MRRVIPSAPQEVSVCSGWGWRQSHPWAKKAEQGGRREGKIKADGTPWVRSGGQVLVCTLFWVAPSPSRHGATGYGKPGIFSVSHGTLARNRRFRADQRP